MILLWKHGLIAYRYQGCSGTFNIRMILHTGPEGKRHLGIKKVKQSVFKLFHLKNSTYLKLRSTSHREKCATFVITWH